MGERKREEWEDRGGAEEGDRGKRKDERKREGTEGEGSGDKEERRGFETRSQRQWRGEPSERRRSNVEQERYRGATAQVASQDAGARETPS